MFQSFIKIFIRAALRNKFYSFINILGLAIGMACSILILLWVQDELSYDTYNEKFNQIYRIDTDGLFNHKTMRTTSAPAPLAATIIREIPGVQNTVRFRSYGSFVIAYENQSFKENKIIFADSTLFKVFSIQLLQGNPDKALSEPFTIIINESTAKKYFGNTNPVDKVLKLDNKQDYKITAVYKDLPSNSHFHFDFICSTNSTNESKEDNWLSMNFVTYLVLDKNVKPESVESNLKKIIIKYMGAQVEKMLNLSLSKLESEGTKFDYKLFPLKDIHLYSNYSGEFEANGDIKYVYIFALIAIFILLIACVNFINLATARSSFRSKEIGVKKVLGTDRKQLIIQFLFESLIIVFIAHIIAMILVESVLPQFNILAGKTLTINYFDSKFILLILGIVFTTAFAAGCYPALYLSKFNPLAVLKSKADTGLKGRFLRNFLVVSQFSASIILIICVLFIYRQLDFVQNSKLGYDKERLIILKNTYLLKKQIRSFKDELSKDTRFENITIASFLPIPSERSNNGLIPEDNKEKVVTAQNWGVDFDYIKTFNLKIVAGREFSKTLATDSSTAIINECFAKELGWSNPIGKKIYRPTDVDKKTGKIITKPYEIIGVVKDFNFESLKSPVSSLFLFINNSNDNIVLKIQKNTNVKTILNDLEKNWKKFLPNQPFEYSFLDEDYTNLYKAEQKIGTIVGVFAVLAVFIGCLGLFGLAAFASERRRKEIAIRKINGASIVSVMFNLTGDFIKRVLLSFIIACPVGYYAMNLWLQNFAYATELTWYVFVQAGIISLIIAMLTVCYQAYKAAVNNPVQNLRYE